MTRRIVICCDGTWNVPDDKTPTNVVHFARSIAPVSPGGTTQIVFYDQGVGTGSLMDRYVGGIFGKGLEKNIGDAYRFLVHNYQDGDEVFLFGFSRGAYTARSVAGMIRNVGLLHKAALDKFLCAFNLYINRDAGPTSSEAETFRSKFSREIDIHFIGVWDTVGALGIPIQGLRWLTRGKHLFHDVELSGSVKNGFHAISIDEKREAFIPSIWDSVKKNGQVVEQVWFAGVHSDVGGGYSRSGLSDLAYDWMKEKAEGCGLEFDDEYISQKIHEDYLTEPHVSKRGIYKYLRSRNREIGNISRSTEKVHPGIEAKFNAPGGSYRPDNLARFLAAPEHPVAETAWKAPGSDDDSEEEEPAE